MKTKYLGIFREIEFFNFILQSRDLALGFSSVSGTYLSIGCLFYAAFPIDKECIEDVSSENNTDFNLTNDFTKFFITFQNFLNNFHVNNPLMAVVRFFLLLQLFTVFPLIMFILRCQILMLVSKTVQVGYRKIYAINSSIFVICVLFAIFIPSIGT